MGEPAETPFVLSVVERRRLVGLFRRDRTATAALFFLSGMIVVAVLAPLLTPYSTTATDLGARFMAPSLSHPFGTDDLGRDLLARIMMGARVSLLVGALAMTIALILGVAVGLVSGYTGGWVDAMLMRLTDLVLSIPVFLVVLLLSSVMVPGLFMICLLIGTTQWMEVSRVVRSIVLSTKRREFVDAARALGASDGRIMLRHVLAHTTGPLLVSATLGFAQAILFESTISFLGFGVQPPTASWGSVLQNAQTHLGIAPWMAVFPGLMIFLTVLCVHVLGDFLRSASAQAAP